MRIYSANAANDDANAANTDSWHSCNIRGIRASYSWCL